MKGDQLVLAPFQGPIACTRIGYGKGVCGAAWKEARTVVVHDVEAFPGHIACNSAARSEIVVPVFEGEAVGGAGRAERAEGEAVGGAGWAERAVVAVLDIDSEATGSFDAIDAFYLERICRLL